MGLRRGLLLKLLNTLQYLFKLFVLVCWHFKYRLHVFIVSVFTNVESTQICDRKETFEGC